MQYVRNTTVYEDVNGLLELQKKHWSYFMGKLFELSERDGFDSEHLGTETNIEENKLLLDAITNLQMRKAFYNNLYN